MTCEIDALLSTLHAFGRLRRCAIDFIRQAYSLMPLRELLGHGAAALQLNFTLEIWMSSPISDFKE